LPFRAMIRNGVDMIMTAHVTFPAIDDREGVPATLSNPCLTGLLRERLGFDQVIITDAFNMKAIADRFGDKEAALMAIQAGADIVLMPQNLPDTFDYILEHVRNGAIPEARIDASVKRILALKLKTGIIGPGVKSGWWSRYRAVKTVGGKEHAFIRRTVAERAVTLLKNEADNLPFRLEANRRIVCFAPSQAGLDRVREDLRALAGGAGVKAMAIQGYNYDGQRSVKAAQKEAIAQSDFILLFTRTLKAADLSPDSFMPQFAADLMNIANVPGKKLVAVSVRNPYDVQVLTGIKSQIAVYSDWDGGGVAAALKVIFGKINPVGKLPVSLPDSDGKVMLQAGHGLSYSMDRLMAIERSAPVYSSLAELWDRGMLDDIGSFKTDAPVDGRELVHSLKRMLLITGGHSWDPGLNGKHLSRYGMIGLFKKAAAAAGFNPATVKGYFDGKRWGSIRSTQGEMVEAAAGFLRLLETGKMKAGGAER
jgi:beta-N-acetylhexosaminidase